MNNVKYGYYIAYDNDYPKILKGLGSTHFHIHGKINDSIKNDYTKIPLLLDLNDAISLADKYAKEAIRDGTGGNGSFPIAGVLIFKIEIGNGVKINSEEHTYTHGKVEYGKLFKFFNSDEMILYKVNIPKDDGTFFENSRAIISFSGFKKCKIVNVMYGKKLSTDKHIAFAILNAVSNMKDEDIKILNKAYNNENGYNYDENNKSNETPSTNDIVNKLKSQMIGPTINVNNDNNDDYTKYKNEKKRYLELKTKLEHKKKQINLETNHKGGDYKKYKEEKARYLQLKKIAKQRGIV